MAKWCGINGVHKDVQECKLNSALCECGKQPLSQIIERAVEGFFAAPRPGHQPSDLDAIIDAIRGVESGFDRDEARAILARALAAAPQAPSGQQAEPTDAVDDIAAILYQCDRGNVSLPWLIAALRGIQERAALAAAPQAPAGQAVGEREPWLLYLSDRADGVKGRYTIARWNPEGYREVWNLRRHEWGAFSDEVLTLEEARSLLKTASLASSRADRPAPAGQAVYALIAQRLAQIVELSRQRDDTLLINEANALCSLVHELFRAPSGHEPTDESQWTKVDLWAEIHRLRAAVKGPEGHASWQEAATAERIRRVKAERALAASQAERPAVKEDGNAQ